MEVLNLEEILAQLLASEGFLSIKSLADADINSVANIEGLDEEIAKELISRSKEYLDSHKQKDSDSDSDSDLTHASN